MANKTLDPTTCTTAEEAFKYPLPQVRQFHRNLTAELDEKNARLRTLVGGSYMQLLGTAEMILQMRNDIGKVEDKLGDVGQACGRDVLGGMVAGLGRLENERRSSKSREKMGWVARMKVLNMCGIVNGKLLRRGGEEDIQHSRKGKNLVLAAKVRVLGRLLAKSLGDSIGDEEKEEQEMVEEARRKLSSLERRLLRIIKRNLERVDLHEDKEDLAQVLSAYSLATSSGARDVLRHFLHIRGQAMTLSFEDEEDSKRDIPGVVKALGLYTRTLLDVQALVPRRLAEALAQLKKHPLLKDSSFHELEGLRLDICEKWSGDEILFFTPYIRHDDLEGSHAVDMLKGWAKRAFEVLLQGLSKTLQTINDFKTVVELRTRILEVWIKGGKARGFDPSILLDGIRRVVNDRMVQLLQSRGSKLHLVGTEIEATLSSLQDGVTNKTGSLWDEDMLETDISNGASLFKQGILSRTNGRNEAVSRAVHGYQTWRHLIDEIFSIFEQLRKQRWDEDLEEMGDESDLESRNELLSQDDTQMLQEGLNESLEKAFSTLHEKISALLTAYQETHGGQISIYMLRVIRDIRSELPRKPDIRTFGLSLVPPLHQKLASIVCQEPVAIFSKSFRRKRVAGRSLWEGSPEYPVQPSPTTFKFLHNLALAMAKAGGDLWSLAALRVMKSHLRSELGHELALFLKQKQPQVNGTAANGKANSDDIDSTHDHQASEAVEISDEDKDAQKDVLIQSLFDVFTLQCACGQSDAEDELQALCKTVGSSLELETPSRKRLLQGAKEYWKRTNLLFGPLSS